MKTEKSEVDAGMQDGSSASEADESKEVEASAEELGQALAEAAEEAAQDPSVMPDSGEHSGFMKPAQNTSWTQLDRILTLILCLNILFMAVIVFVPWPEEAENVKDTVAPIGNAKDLQDKGGKGGETLLKPRNPLYSQAEELYGQGKTKEAVASLERLLQEEPDLHDSVRRAIYMKLAYYSGVAGLVKKSTTYRLLAQAGLQRGLLPEDLWDMAQEAYRVKDYPLARRYTARFLLQEGFMAERQKKIKPLAYLSLADGYRMQADKKVVEENK